jgi:hypothetical protein
LTAVPPPGGKHKVHKKVLQLLGRTSTLIDKLDLKHKPEVLEDMGRW